MWAGLTKQALFKEAEDLLEKWKHPDPYRAPTAPGGKMGVIIYGFYMILMANCRIQVRA